MDQDSQIVTPHGQRLLSEKGVTERGEERRREDESYVPVIIKRNDEAKVHPDDILERAINEGYEQLKRPLFSLALSAVAAGLILGVSALAVAVVASIVPPDTPWLLRRLAMAGVYPLGFVICIMSGTQLFTEHTATAVYPVLDRRSSALQLLRLWIVVILGNLAGAYLGASIITSADAVIQAREGYLSIADHLVAFDFPSLLGSSILAGILMAQGAWLILATPPQSSQLFCIYLVTFLIGIGGLHHSIAGSAEVFAALLFEPGLGIAKAGYFIGSALLGNLVGGSLFVAVLNYAHIRKTQEVE